MTRARHVRVEMRRVYVSARGARLTKRAAYEGAARALITKACQCEAEPDVGYFATCRLHTSCCKSFNSCEHPDRSPYLTRVLTRLVRFLKFVDKRIAPEPMTIAQLRKRGFKPHGLQP